MIRKDMTRVLLWRLVSIRKNLRDMREELEKTGEMFAAGWIIRIGRWLCYVGKGEM